MGVKEDDAAKRAAQSSAMVAAASIVLDADDSEQKQAIREAQSSTDAQEADEDDDTAKRQASVRSNSAPGAYQITTAEGDSTAKISKKESDDESDKPFYPPRPSSMYSDYSSSFLLNAPPTLERQDRLAPRPGAVIIDNPLGVPFNSSQHALPSPQPPESMRMATTSSLTTLPVADLSSVPVAIEAQVVEDSDEIAKTRAKLKEKLDEIKSLSDKLRQMEAMQRELESLRSTVAGAVPAQLVESVSTAKGRSSLQGFSSSELHALNVLLGEEIAEKRKSMREQEQRQLTATQMPPVVQPPETPGCCVVL